MQKESLPLRYRPKCFAEIVGQPITVSILSKQIETSSFRNAYLFTGAAGCGKAQPNDSIVKTPKGDVAIGDLEVGSIVLGFDGRPQVVEGVYPQGNRKVVKISFDDGTSTICDYEHIWRVGTRSHGSIRWRDLTINEILNEYSAEKINKHVLRIPSNNVAHYSEKQLPIHPYLLGAFLGNGGYAGSPVIYDYYGDVYMAVTEFASNEFSFNYTDNRACNRFSIHSKEFTKGTQTKDNKFKTALRDLGLFSLKSVDKFIPTEYLLSSKEQRLLLLKGLMDTDGCAYKGNRNTSRVSYSTKSPHLAKGIAELARSLGIRTKIYTLPKGMFDVRFNSTLNIFHIDRKSKKFVPAKQFLTKYIDSIEYFGKADCTCIKVSNEDELYMTNDFIVTHNTTLARLLANEINKGEGQPIEIDGASNNGVDNIRNLIVDAQQTSLDSEYKVYIIDEAHQLTRAAWDAALKLIEEPPINTIFIFCTTNPLKIPDTILSRVQRFDLKRIAPTDIADRLAYIMNEELLVNFQYDALIRIADKSNGMMREAVSLLDKCISFCGSNELNIAVVEKALGLSNSKEILKLIKHILEHDYTNAEAVLGGLKATTATELTVVDDLLTYLIKGAKIQRGVCQTSLTLCMNDINLFKESDKDLFKLVERVLKYRALSNHIDMSVALDILVMELCGGSYGS